MLDNFSELIITVPSTVYATDSVSNTVHRPLDALARKIFSSLNISVTICTLLWQGF